ncbi:MAG: hypothetical protein QXY49_01785 [Thermofilaceae archaeon]
MNDRTIGLLLMVISLCFGTLYAISFFFWISSLWNSFGDKAWSWWVIALPITVIVGFAVFFFTWIGWVMLTASKSKKEELLLGSVMKPSRG